MTLWTLARGGSREKDEALLVKDRQLAALRAEIEKLKKQV